MLIPSLNVQQTFNVFIPAKLSRNTAKAREIGASIQMNITGNDGGNWNIQANGKSVSCVAGSSAASSTLTVSASNWLQIESQSDRGAPLARFMALYSAGALTISGDPIDALKLLQILRLP